MTYRQSIRVASPSRWAARVCLAGLFCTSLGAAPEPIGGYMLVSREGDRSTSPGRAVAGIPMGQVFAMAAPVQYESGAQLVAGVVTQAEVVARRSPAASATNVQRENLQAEKVQAMRQIAFSIVGRNASFGIEVVDVVNRPVEEGAAWARQATVMVIGRLDWVSPMVPSAAYRREAAEAAAEADWRVKELARSRAGAGRGGSPSAAERREIQEALKQQLVELRAKYEGRRPAHYVYLVGGNDMFGAWRRGQRRACRGIVQQAGLFTYVDSEPLEALQVGRDGRVRQEEVAAVVGAQGGEQVEDFSEAYVGLELVVRAIPEAAGKGGK